LCPSDLSSPSFIRLTSVPGQPRSSCLRKTIFAAHKDTVLVGALDFQIVTDLLIGVQRQKVAGLRQCLPRFGCRRPAIERGRIRPRTANLDDDLERSLMAAMMQKMRA
jgi:hypothetical protein